MKFSDNSSALKGLYRASLTEQKVSSRLGGSSLIGFFETDLGVAPMGQANTQFIRLSFEECIVRAVMSQS